MEGVFAKAFRSGLQPVELAKHILREMDAGRTPRLWSVYH
ncbi:MAG TPA: FhaA domain-containing protein [Actinomycetota bacterium]|nr:FhaA domain-containing protein [Actinomycetota bacterium]